MLWLLQAIYHDFCFKFVNDQANSDLQRFLAMRRSGGNDDSPEGPGAQGGHPGRDMMLRSSRKMYGSVEVMDNEDEAGSKRFRVESHNTLHQVMKRLNNSEKIEKRIRNI